MTPAVRALGPHRRSGVHPILKTAFARTAIAEHRLALAGALGIAGDARGLPYVRQVMTRAAERLMPYALEALAYLGNAEDVLAVVEQLEHDDPERVRAAVETLGRIGDGRALLPLSRLFAPDAATEPRPISAALRADAEEADAAIRARLLLLGEEPPELASASQSFNTAKMAAMVRRRRDPAAVRMRARWNVAIARMWLALGSPARAIARVEAAAIMQPGWAGPIVAIATVHARSGEHAQALTSFRAALEIDRNRGRAHSSHRRGAGGASVFAPRRDGRHRRPRRRRARASRRGAGAGLAQGAERAAICALRAPHRA